MCVGGMGWHLGLLEEGVMAFLIVWDMGTMSAVGDGAMVSDLFGTTTPAVAG